MIKKLLYIFCLSIILISLSGCADNVSVENTDDVFIIGVDDQFPPLGYRNDVGEIVGFDVDLAREVASRIGQELVVQQIDWNSKELELSQGNIDAIWNGLSITDERKENMLFTAPYLENDMVIVVKDGSDITSIDDLAGKVIAVQSGSAALDSLNANPIVEEVKDVVTYNDNISAFQDLKIGRADAVIVDSVVANWYIADTNSGLVVVDDSLDPETYGVAFALDNEDLRDLVNSELIAVKNDSTGAEISTEWFGKNILYTEEDNVE